MRTLPIVPVIILVCGAPYSSFAQGVAEGAMAHANSGIATIKLGSALGNTLSNVMGGNAGKMESLSGKVRHVSRASRKTSAQQSSGALLITSIRGTSNRVMQSRLQHKRQELRRRSNTKADPSAHAQMAPATASTTASVRHCRRTAVPV
jgi:hypothetical protein